MSDFTDHGPCRLLPGRVPAYADDACAVYIGDAAEVLRDLPDAVVDAVVTDPPAGIRFRGMRWDTFRPTRPRGRSGEQTAPVRPAFIDFLNPVMRECLRVLKPGGHTLAWAIPRTSHWTATAIEEAGFEVRDVITHHFGTGFPKTRLLARPWRGWSTALKPASEHWILARKPLEGDLPQNLRAYGTGALNIAACRIVRGRLSRWPADLVLSHHPDCGKECVPGCPVAELDEQSGSRPGASTFFYVAKPSPRERNLGLPNAPGTARRRRDERLLFWSVPQPGANNHPTVKSVTLMRYLCRLVTPPGGLVVDPFMGSGSTGVAAIREGFSILGIERDAGYVLDIAVHRLRYASGTDGTGEEAA
jgi:site-specific DNA-methyltransferase (adenine-specific)